VLVLDASAVAELLLGRSAARAVASHLTAHAFDLHAPHLLDVEVLSVIRRLVASGEATPERGDQAIDDLMALPMERYPHDVLVRRAWEHRNDFSAYDAIYLALAEALEPAFVLTADGRLARAMTTHTDVPVILVG
jgi:predicted nucleic acid-binding protein